MIPHVQLVSQTDVRLEDLLGTFNKALGYNVAKPADNATKPKPHERFLSAIACFHDQDNTARSLRDIITASASLTQHLSYGFIVASDQDTILKSMERTRLKHTVATGLTGLQLAIVSGTLAEWTAAITECCNKVSTHNLRMMYTKVLFELEKLGIKFDVNRKPFGDGTLLIESK